MVILFSFPMSIEKIWEKKHCCPFNMQFQQVSVLWQMSNRNLMFLRFMIVQKGVLMWLILYLLINLHASNLPDGCWMAFLLDIIQMTSKVLLVKSSKPNVMNFRFVSESSLFFQQYSITFKIVPVSMQKNKSALHSK